MAEEIIKIELTKEQASLLAFLAPHKDKLEVLIKGNVFDFKFGKKILNYNQAGRITQIETIKKECFIAVDKSAIALSPQKRII